VNLLDMRDTFQTKNPDYDEEMFTFTVSVQISPAWCRFVAVDDSQLSWCCC